MKTGKDIVLNRMTPKLLVVRLEGITPLICHRISESTKKGMQEKQSGKANKMRKARDPEKDFKEALYEHPDGGYGFPAIGFKKAVVRAAKYYPDLDMTQMRGALHVLGELVQIEGSKPVMREDFVRVQGKLDMRYRPMFENWEVELTVQYIEGMVSAEQIISLFESAGTIAGVGDWRPQCDGNFGMFRVKGTEKK